MRDLSLELIALLATLAVALASPHITPLQRLANLRGDHVFGWQLYQGVLYGASPDYTPVPDVPCFVTYRPDQGLKEVCLNSLLSNGGVVEDLALVEGELYGFGRGDTSYGRLNSVYLLKRSWTWKVVNSVSKERWGSPYIERTMALFAPLRGGRLAALVELNRAWRDWSTSDVRLLLFSDDGRLIKDVSLAPPLNVNVDYFYYMLAGYENYVLVVQSWKDGDGVDYIVVAYNVDTSQSKIIERGHVDNVYTLTVSKIYKLQGGDQYAAIYYLLRNGTLMLKVYSPYGLIYRFEKELPFKVVDGTNPACCRRERWFSSIAYDEGGFYIPLSVEIDENGQYKWVEVLVGKNNVYVFDERREDWGTSLARVAAWNVVLVGGRSSVGVGYAYALPDPHDPITLTENSSPSLASSTETPKDNTTVIVVILPTIINNTVTMITTTETVTSTKYLPLLAKGIPLVGIPALIAFAWRGKRSSSRSA